MSKQISMQRYVLKVKVLTHYGNGKCVCVRCGFDNVSALTIDHINDDGNEHRKKIGTHICKWLSDNNYPKGYQTLCMNCQFIKRFSKEPIYSRINKIPRITNRIRKWIDLSEDKFTLYEIRKGLNLDIADRKKAKELLSRMAKNGELIRLSFGVYKKTIRPVKVFG